MNYQIKYDGPFTPKLPLIDKIFGIYSITVQHINVDATIYINKHKVSRSTLFMINDKFVDISLSKHCDNLVIVLDLQCCVHFPIKSISTKISPHTERIFKFSGPVKSSMDADHDFIFPFPNQLKDEYRTRRNIGENNIWRNTTQNHFGGLNVGDFIKLYLYAHIILMCVCRR